MGIRNKPENRGLWVLPGGEIGFCESFEQTLRREIEAEAGIQITPGAFFRVYELINPPNEHRVIIYLHGTHLSGTPKASTDLSEVRYLLPIEIKALGEQKQDVYKRQGRDPFDQKCSALVWMYFRRKLDQGC